MPQYRFDVDANIKKAQQNINSLMGLLGRLDKATGNTNIGGVKDSDNVDGLLNDYQKLSSEYNDLTASAKKYEQSSNFKGKTDDFQKLDTMLAKASGTLSELAKGINSLGSSGGGLGNSVKEAEQYKTTLGDNVKLIKEIRRDEALARRLGNQQDAIATRATSNGYISTRDISKYTRNQKQIENLHFITERNNGMIHDFQNQYDSLKKQNITGLNEEGNPLSTEDRKNNDSQMKDINKVLHTLRSSNTTVEATEETAASSDSMLKASPLMIGTKASAVLMAVDIGLKAITASVKAFNDAVRAGNQVNSSTGEQALNIGNTSGHVADSDIRGRVQNIMWQNGLGYKTQEGLDYYALAQQSRTYRANDASSDRRAESMTNAFEVAGRSTGISNKSWQQIATTSMQSGGILSDNDINRLSTTIAGANMRSGNSGNTEENARIISSAIQQLSRSGVVNQNGVGNLAATTALLSRSSNGLSSSQVQQEVKNVNQGFQNAGSGKDNALLYMMISSNPARYGGPNGMVKAQETLNQGLSNPENIDVVQNYVRRLGLSGSQGRGVATLMLEQHFGLPAKEADKLSEDMMSGRYTTSQIAKEAQSIRKTGSQQTRRNLRNYKRSDQATYNSQAAQGEAIQSQAAGMTKWWRDIQTGTGQFVHGIGTMFSSPANYIKGAAGIGKGIFDSTPLGSAINFGIGVDKSVINGIGKMFGGNEVHADTLSKKEMAKDKASHKLVTRSRGKTTSKKPSTKKSSHVSSKSRLNSNSKKSSSSKTISNKQQDEAKTKSFLNTKNEEKNLRAERDNIDRRNASLTEFAKLLREEKDKAGSGSSGKNKAGTVGKKGIDYKTGQKKGEAAKKKNLNLFSGLSNFFKPKVTTKSSAATKKKSSGSKHYTNNNNISLNVSGIGKDIESAFKGFADRVAKKTNEYSRNLIKRD